MRAAILAALFALTCSGCVMAGGEGVRSNFANTSAGSMTERREALRSVTVVSAPPAGAVSLGGVGTRRCHRYFTEEEPNEAAITADLKMAAFAQGADAIRITDMEKVNGLAADCWYVLEAKAEMYRLR